MDLRVRQNENCIIGLPSCGFTFNSQRSCFIAYWFDETDLEVSILRNLLEANNIIPYEAGSDVKPGQFAFCSKICSRIITSQFCIVMLNSKSLDKGEAVNPNVYMEYGLMLGFNKYVIPFQKEDDVLPFNVSGLDTIKYSKSNI